MTEEFKRGLITGLILPGLSHWSGTVIHPIDNTGAVLSEFRKGFGMGVAFRGWKYSQNYGGTILECGFDKEIRDYSNYHAHAETKGCTICDAPDGTRAIKFGVYPSYVKFSNSSIGSWYLGRVEFDFYPLSTPEDGGLLLSAADIMVRAADQLIYKINGKDEKKGTHGIQPEKWYHFKAEQKDSGETDNNFRTLYDTVCYIDGEEDFSIQMNSILYFLKDNLYIGCDIEKYNKKYDNAKYQFSGYIKNLKEINIRRE